MKRACIYTGPSRARAGFDDARGAVMSGCRCCWIDAVEYADADEHKALAYYNEAALFCRHTIRDRLDAEVGSYWPRNTP